jgi:KUP system potassium uptake protein
LTLIVTVKYIFVVLRADDEGEGGTFAAFSLLSRYSDIMKRDPRRLSLVKTKRSPPEDLHRSTQGFRAWLEKSKIAHGILKLLAVVGISLILADGVLTPAISVLGAMQGLQVADERVSNPTIIGTSCAVIVLLFLAQPWGVHRVSVFFTPVIITWLLFNGSFGIYNLVRHNHMVLKAFSPYYAGAWFMRNKTAGWEKL